LLASDKSILRFLDKAVTLQDRKLNKTKENLLIFLDEYVTFLGRRVEDYALDIKVWIHNMNS
jgi:hypothetical protein